MDKTPLLKREANFSHELTDLNTAEDIIIPVEIKIPVNEIPERSVIIARIEVDEMDFGPIADLLVDHDYTPSNQWSGWNPAKGALLRWILHQTEGAKQFFKG